MRWDFREMGCDGREAWEENDGKSLISFKDEGMRIGFK